jgi:hypothetical protein
MQLTVVFLKEVKKARPMRQEGHLKSTGDRGIAYVVWVGDTRGKRPFARSRRRWKYNIKQILKKCDRVVCTGLIWRRIGRGRERGGAFGNAVLNICFP